MNKHGLTLIELLVTLALLSVTMGIAFSMFSGGGRIWQRAQCATAQEQKALLAFQDMRVHLRGIQPFKPFEFEGESEKITFPALAPSPFKKADGLNEPSQITYYLRDDDQTLCRAVLPYRMKRAKRYDDLPCTEIMNGIKEWSLDYLNYNDSSKTHGWRGSASETFPLAVKVEIEYVDSCTEDYVKKSQTITLPTGRIR